MIANLVLSEYNLHIKKGGNCMKQYVKPTMESEVFTANEYIASTCGVNTVYKFECDGGKYDTIFGDIAVPGTVFEDSNGNGHLDNGDKDLTSSWFPTYHACGKAHEAPTTDEFLKGFYRPLGSKNLPVQDVIIWTEGGTNVHCTQNIKMDNWETQKS